MGVHVLNEVGSSRPRMSTRVMDAIVCDLEASAGVASRSTPSSPQTDCQPVTTASFRGRLEPTLNGRRQEDRRVVDDAGSDERIAPFGGGRRVRVRVLRRTVRCKAATQLSCARADNEDLLFLLDSPRRAHGDPTCC